jgi:nitrite reductase (NO-forming)
MYGLILVEPAGGLAPVDREFYVMQGDFYTQGPYGEAGLQPFSMAKAIDERPDYVLFNGAVGAIAGDNALPAKRGERVRIFFGNGGPNLVSSFHVIGEIFDNVHIEGGDLVNTNVQTTLVPAGGAAIVDFALDVPGTFILVDHSIFRAFNKGAIGMIKASGEPDALVYSGRQDERIYLPEGGAILEHPGKAEAPAPAATLEDRIARGRIVYETNCIACHQGTGQGIPRAFPPLANSDFLNADVDRAIGIVANGLQGPITVNGEKYETVMPRLGLSPEQIANVLSYVLNSWENAGGEVTPERVQKVLGGS